MNAFTPLSVALPHEPFDHARQRVNEWRGQCLDAFTRAEAAVTKCLALLSKDPVRGGAVDLPHLVGQRFEALAKALSQDGPFAAEGAPVAAALAAFRAHDAFRTALCHGVWTVTLDRSGKWSAVIRIATFRASRLDETLVAYRERDAELLRAKMVGVSHDLCSRLGQVRAAFGAT